MFSPSVITSKPARKDYQRIVSAHTDIVQGIAQQAERVTQQRQAALQAQQTMQAEFQKEKMTYDSSARRDAIDFQKNQADADIKRAQLSLT